MNLLPVFPFADSWLAPLPETGADDTSARWKWSVEQPDVHGARRVPFRDPGALIVPETNEPDEIVSAVQVFLAQRAATSPRLAGYTPVEMMPPNQKLYTSVFNPVRQAAENGSISNLTDMAPDADLCEHVGWFPPGVTPDVFGAAFLYATSTFRAGTQWNVGFVGVGEPQSITANWDDDVLADLYDFVEQPAEVHVAFLGLSYSANRLIGLGAAHKRHTRVRRAREAFAAHNAHREQLCMPDVDGVHVPGAKLGIVRNFSFVQSEVFGVDHTLPPVPSAFIYPIRADGDASPAQMDWFAPLPANPGAVDADAARAMSSRFAATVLTGNAGYTVIRLLTGTRNEVGVVANLELFAAYRDMFGYAATDRIEVFTHGQWAPIPADSSR